MGGKQKVVENVNNLTSLRSLEVLTPRRQASQLDLVAVCCVCIIHTGTHKAQTRTLALQALRN
jgi:hypothetical protein